VACTEPFQDTAEENVCLFVGFSPILSVQIYHFYVPQGTVNNSSAKLSVAEGVIPKK